MFSYIAKIGTFEKVIFFAANNLAKFVRTRFGKIYKLLIEKES